MDINNGDKLDLIHILIKNIGIFFFKLIALKFIPVEPSFIKKKFIEKIQKY